MDRRRVTKPATPTRLHPAERAVGEHLRESASQDTLLTKLALLRAAAVYVDPKRYPLPPKGSAEHRIYGQLRRMDAKRLRALADSAAKRLADRRWMAAQFGSLAKLDLRSDLPVAKLAAKLSPDVQRHLPKRGALKRSRFKAPDPDAVNLRASQLPLLPVVPLIPVRGPDADLQIQDDPRQSLLTDPVLMQSFVSAMAAISMRYEQIKAASRLLGDPISGIPNHGGGWYSRRYEHGVIYHKRPNLTLALYRSSVGYSSIPEKYLNIGAHTTALSFPLTEVKDVPHAEGRIALFEGGVIVQRRPQHSHPACVIPSWSIVGLWMSYGMAAGDMGFPLEDAHEEATRGGDPGLWVQFNRGRIYHAETTGTHRVEWMLSVTHAQHADALGFPTSEARAFGQGQWRLQTFEGGAIVFRRDTFEQRVVLGKLWELWWSYRDQPGFGGVPAAQEPLPGGHGWCMRCPNWTLMWDGADKTAIAHPESYEVWHNVVRSSAPDPGFPLSNELQHQVAGCFTLQCPGAVVLRTPGRPTRWISPASFAKWLEWGGLEGQLGWPAEDFKRGVFVNAQTRQKEPYAAAIFEDAIIYDRDGMGAFMLLGPWLLAHNRSLHGLPESDIEPLYEVLGAAAQFRRVVIFQADEAGDEAYVIHTSVFQRWLALSPIASGLGWPVDRDKPLYKGGVAVGRQLQCQRGTLYQTHGQTGRALTGAHDAAYRRLGQADSFLGLPQGAPFTRDGGDTQIVSCEHGALVTGAYLTDAVGVPGEVYALWHSMGYGDGALGRPISDPLGDPRYTLHYGQPFQGGMVSVNKGQAAAQYTKSEVLLRLERLDVYKQTSGESGRDDVTLSTAAIRADSSSTHHETNLGHFHGGTGKDFDRVLFRVPLHGGSGWPKSYAALLSPVERDDGGLSGVAATLLDVAQEAVERAAKRAASAAINAYLGGVPPLAYIADYLAGELIEDVVAELFDWFADLFEDPDDVFKPKLVRYGLFRYDRANGQDHSSTLSTKGPLFTVSFKEHGAHWSFALRWEVDLKS